MTSQMLQLSNMSTTVFITNKLYLSCTALQLLQQNSLKHFKCGVGYNHSQINGVNYEHEANGLKGQKQKHL